MCYYGASALNSRHRLPRNEITRSTDTYLLIYVIKKKKTKNIRFENNLVIIAMWPKKKRSKIVLGQERKKNRKTVFDPVLYSRIKT